MEKRLCFTLRDPEAPAPPVPVLGILPDGLHALAEDVHRVAQPDLVPGVIVVNAVEGGNVGDILVQYVEPRVIVCVRGVGVSVVPDGPVVLEGEWS